MFVQFRQRGQRLLLTLFETRREGGRVKKEYIANLGSILAESTIDDRIAFWQQLHTRLAKLSNRVDAATQAKLLAAIHERIPMVVVDEQRDVQLRNACAEEKFWSGMRDMTQATIDGTKQLIATAEQAVAKHQVAVDAADARATVARERREKIERGESVDGGLGRPMDREDLVRVLLDCGYTRHDLRFMQAAAQLPLEELLEMSRAGLNEYDRRFKRAVIKLVKLLERDELSGPNGPPEE